LSCVPDYATVAVGILHEEALINLTKAYLGCSKNLYTADRIQQVMKKEIVCISLLLLLLVACGGPKVSGKKVASTPTGAVVGVPDEPTPQASPTHEVEQAESSKTAAEALEEVKKSPQAVEASSASKAGSSWYPPVVTSSTGKDALHERTKAAFSRSSFNTSVDADRQSGARYYDSSGDADNLPEGYGEDQSYE